MICDFPTLWKSTLGMLKWLHLHQWAINDNLCEYVLQICTIHLSSVSEKHVFLFPEEICLHFPTDLVTQPIKNIKYQIKHWFVKPVVKPWCQLELAKLHAFSPLSFLMASTISAGVQIEDHPTIQAACEA